MTHESDVLSSDTALRAKLLIKFEEETKQAEEVRIIQFLICTSASNIIAENKYILKFW